ncbi:MAG: 3-dehydroquinate synthase [Candidatus Omnitrophota bacterium]
MKIIKVNLKERSYNIIIGQNAISKFSILLKDLNLGNTAIVITNNFIRKRFWPVLEKELKKTKLSYRIFLIPDSEKAKSFKELVKLSEQIVKYGQDKKTFLIALGGGVIGDLTGFCASIYKRGVPYIQIPTTLLAQVDSSIGGKTAIDLGFAKNLIGSFYQPKLVISDINFLKYLPEKEIKAGLSEIIKYAIIKDAELFNTLEKKQGEIFKRNPSYLEYIVSSSSKIKADIVTIDEKETKSKRLILNFGHTIGHAIEAMYDYRYSHGQAVALGMIYETRLSYLLGLISKNIMERIEKLISLYNIAPKIKLSRIKKLLYILKFDKKFVGKKNRFVLPTQIGKTKIVENIPEKLIKQTLILLSS